MIKFIPWILTTILYSPVFYELYKGRWDSVDYTHAYFILPLSLLIVWTKRKEIKASIDLRDCRVALRAPRNDMLCLFIVSLLLFILGWRNDYMFIQAFSLIPLLLGMTTYLYGWKVTRIVLFPILYLLLLVPSSVIRKAAKIRNMTFIKQIITQFYLGALNNSYFSHPDLYC